MKYEVKIALEVVEPDPQRGEMTITVDAPTSDAAMANIMEAIEELFTERTGFSHDPDWD